MKKLIPLLFTVITAIGFFASCRPKQVDATQRMQDSLLEDSLSLKIGCLPTLESLPFFVAQQEGYLTHSRIKLLRYDAAMDLDTALQKNRVHLITSDLCRAILLHQKDKEIHVIGRTENPYYLITAQKQRLRKVGDLKERTIAIARHEITDFLLDAMLEHEGMEPDMVNCPQVNSIPLRKLMLNLEELDAALLPEPYATACLQQGDRKLLCNTDIDAEISCLVLNSSAASMYGEQLEKAVEAYNRAVEWLQQNRPDLCAFYDIERSVADSLKLPNYQPLSLPREKDLKRCQAWLQSQGLLTHPISDLVEERFIK